MLRYVGDLSANFMTHIGGSYNEAWNRGVKPIFVKNSPIITHINTRITVTSLWMPWRLESPGSPLFAHPFIRAQIKENTQVPRRWPLWGEKTSNAETVWWGHHEVYRMPHTLHPTKHVLFLRFVVCYVSVDYRPFLLISFSIISLKLGERSNHEG